MIQFQLDNIQNNLSVSLYPIVNLQEIETRWNDNHKKVDFNRFFTSFDWLQEVIKLQQQAGGQVFYLEANIQQSCLAVGQIYADDGSDSFYLHKTGNPVLDQVWIEFNDLVFCPQVRAEYIDPLRENAYQWLFRQNALSIQSLNIDMTAADLSETESYYCINTLSSIGFYKNLIGTSNLNTLLASFSKNTRRQINKSIQLLSKEGELALDIVSDKKAKQEALKSLAPMHINQWQDSDWGSGFTNPNFVEFHQSLVASNHCQIMKLILGDKTLAYGYYFCFNKRAYFYLSSVNKHSDNRIKIGLVLHTFAMEHYAQRGFEQYDFLAGDARYKRSLSDSEYTLRSFRLVKKNWRGHIEMCARKIKKLIRIDGAS